MDNFKNSITGSFYGYFKKFIFCAKNYSSSNLILEHNSSLVSSNHRGTHQAADLVSVRIKFI